MNENQSEDLKKYAAIASTNFHQVEQCMQENRFMEAAAIRSALESALKVYWVYRWNCYDPTETLYEKINSLAENGEFNVILINHMHMIRRLGNKQLHDNDVLDVKTANDLFDIFKKCIQAISEKVGIDLMNYGIAESKDDVENTNRGNMSEGGRQMHEKNFWTDFQKLLDENGGEYGLEFINNDMARVKRHASATNLFVVVDPAAEKVLLFEKNGMRETCIKSSGFTSLDIESLLLEIDKKCSGTSIVQAEQTAVSGKILYKLGQVWEGKSYVDLINKIFHKNYKSFIPCTLKLEQFDAPGIAWIVVINGTPHGGNGDLWVNRLFDNGETIEEEYVGVHSDKIRQEFLTYRERTFSDRLTFQKDPDNNGNAYKAKCLGFYILKSYDTDKLIRVWKRQRESLVLNFR